LSGEKSRAETAESENGCFDSAVFRHSKIIIIGVPAVNSRGKTRDPERKGKESPMASLKGYQRKYLRGLAHALKPVVQVGRKGLTDGVAESLAESLDTHELVKVKFMEHKEKDQKAYFCEIIETQTGAEMVGMIGHTAIFFRPHLDPEKRRIALPRK